MSIGDYIKAKRLGEASYRESLEKGQYPYLQVLDEILNHVTIVSETLLKDDEIPLDRVRGTFAAGRRTAFAPNFMPLLDDNTEFSEKWSFLFDSLKKEGIRDAVKCYEYMGYYYIVEGNKRVSAMKYLGAETIPARVTRLVPRYENDKAHEAYYEYLEFYKKCPENYMVFSEPGAYIKFLMHVRKTPDHVWDEQEIRDLKSNFYRFQKAFRSLYPDQSTPSMISNGFLSFLHVYNYYDIPNRTSEQLKNDLRAMEQEFELSESGRNVSLLLDEDEIPRRGIFSFLANPGTGNRTLKIAFVHGNDIYSSEWVYLHELGKNHLENVFGNRVDITSYYNVNPFSDVYQILGKCGEENYDLVFTTSRRFLDATLAIAVRFPRTRFLCCTLNSIHRYVRAYFTRNYEAAFLAGMVAGSITQDDKIGYIGTIPVAEFMSTLNAFALGVKMMRPSARIYLCWECLKDSDPKEFFRKNNIHLIHGRDMMKLSSPVRDYGLYEYHDGKIKNIAMMIQHWGIVYQKIVESVQSGAYDDAAENENSKNALNYWWGLSSGAVDLIYTEDLPPQTIRLIEYTKNLFKDGMVPVFSGKINSSKGPVTKDAGDFLLPKDIINMNWFMDNIIYEEPGFLEMTTENRAMMLSHINP